ncbi:hypothetical protein LTR37_008977 [Vermiconidia calcicola]|uniref:Uncharacterized protein n=1 Tax=Vermiconidia calcicola TaxID=1690605 RepID=A0ACC3N962_9PEZI|nr:hypothetical protein LTR37_008977 [Vermiconidia calcicola]
MENVTKDVIADVAWLTESRKDTLASWPRHGLSVFLYYRLLPRRATTPEEVESMNEYEDYDTYDTAYQRLQAIHGSQFLTSFTDRLLVSDGDARGPDQPYTAVQMLFNAKTYISIAVYAIDFPIILQRALQHTVDKLRPLSGQCALLLLHDGYHCHLYVLKQEGEHIGYFPLWTALLDSRDNVDSLRSCITKWSEILEQDNSCAEQLQSTRPDQASLDSFGEEYVNRILKESRKPTEL